MTEILAHFIGGEAVSAPVAQAPEPGAAEVDAAVEFYTQTKTACCWA